MSHDQKKPPHNPVGFTPILNNPDLPPYDGRLYPGRGPVYGGHPGTWGAGAEGDVVGLVGTNANMPAAFYNNVEGNPGWSAPGNPSYVWNTNTATWVR